MINTEKLTAVIAAYKERFPTQWTEEKYKWDAICIHESIWNISMEK